MVDVPCNSAAVPPLPRGLPREDTPVPIPDVEVLDPPTCLALLSTVTVGRIGFTLDALPAIQPVPFLLHGDQVVAATPAGSGLVAGSRGAVVVFQADALGPGARAGWTVSVVGPSRPVRDPAEAAVLDGLPWLPGTLRPDRCYVTVAAGRVQGWRARPPVSPAPVEEVRTVHLSG
jgi:uncharacterized protein